MKASSYLTLMSIGSIMLVLTACTQHTPVSDQNPLPSTRSAVSTSSSLTPPERLSSSGGLSRSVVIATGAQRPSDQNLEQVSPQGDQGTTTPDMTAFSSWEVTIEPIPSRGARLVITPGISFQFPLSSPSQLFFFSRDAEGLQIYAYTSDKSYPKIALIFTIRRAPYAELQRDCQERMEQKPNCRDSEIITRLNATDILALTHPQDGPSDIDSLLGVFGPRGYESAKEQIVRTLTRQ